MFEARNEVPLYVRDQLTGKLMRRSGSCSPNCGACCEFMVLPLDKRLLEQSWYSDWVHWAKLHDVIIYESGDRLVARLPIPCKELTEDKMCALFGSDERPDMCSRYPRSVREMKGVEDVCTYKFEEVDE